ncbi:DUF3772 domain-containing protein [Roseovarius sp. CAU 1744]|uniref:DUF3772 domain-containing protein n=1 Tax=Roseovarius sp. CAU 1744 TaxID=3140368 RepID=UPI00325AABE9
MTRIRQLLLVLALVCAGLASVLAMPASAQPGSIEPDYPTWENVATRADNAIASGRASITALEELRNQIADWRQQFLDAQSVNRSAIGTVSDQLDALGPAPENGNEAEDIASQRTQLNERLSELQAPVKKAELAYSRADGLIKGIDQIVRDRQKAELLELGPSPLNIAHWDDGLNALLNAYRTLHSELRLAWRSPVQRADTKENLPLILVLLAIGVALVARGRRWCRVLSRRVLKPDERPGAARWLVAFAISVGELLLPYVGALMIVAAMFATGLVGLRTEQMLTALLVSLFIYFLARWVSVRIFPFRTHRDLPLNLDDDQRRTGRVLGTGLGLVVALVNFLEETADIFDWSEAAMIVTIFPVTLVAAGLLWRLSKLLKIHTEAGGVEGVDTFRNRLVRLICRAILVLAVVAPVLAAIGYFKAAEALMLPALLSLLLLAVLVVLQRLVNEVYVLLSRKPEDGADSLTTVVAGFVLVLLSLPVFALIWGARVTDLTELWTRFTSGIELGGVRISPTIFLTLALVFTAGYLLTRFIQGTLKNTVLPKTNIDTGGQNAIVSGVGYIGIFLAAIVAVTSAGIDLSSLAIVAGALSVGIGFGLQNIVSNFVSGIILLIERPISEGDWIEVGGTHGYVRDISVRSTTIETFDRSDVIVPNADLVSGTVTNYTKGNTVGRVIVPVGVAYGSDTKQVEQILREIAEAHPMVVANPPPNVVFRGFGADSLDFEIRAILRDVNWMLNVHSDMNHEIARKFADNSIEIPFAQRDVWLRNPETLQNAAPPPPAEPAPKAPKRRTRIKDMDAGDGDGDQS